MTPEVAAFLAKAAKLLADGAKVDSVGLHDEAGRAAEALAGAGRFLEAVRGSVGGGG